MPKRNGTKKLQGHTLARFIQAEMRKHEKLSIREFARFVGVSQPTIGEILNEPHKTPSLRTLVKLAEATGTRIDVLVMMAVPESVRTEGLDPYMVMLAIRLGQLSKEAQELLLRSVGL